MVYDPSALESNTPEFSSVVEAPISEDELSKCYKIGCSRGVKTLPGVLSDVRLFNRALPSRRSVIHQIQKRFNLVKKMPGSTFNGGQRTWFSGAVNSIRDSLPQSHFSFAALVAIDEILKELINQSLYTCKMGLIVPTETGAREVSKIT